MVHDMCRTTKVRWVTHKGRNSLSQCDSPRHVSINKEANLNLNFDPNLHLTLTLTLTVTWTLSWTLILAWTLTRTLS